MAEREHESNGDGTAASLHHFASDVINCRDVVRVHCMSEPHAIREESRSQQNAGSSKTHDCPNPGTVIKQQQETINSEDSTAEATAILVEQAGHLECHIVPFQLRLMITQVLS